MFSLLAALFYTLSTPVSGRYLRGPGTNLTNQTLSNQIMTNQTMSKALVLVPNTSKALVKIQPWSYGKLKTYPNCSVKSEL